MIAYPPGFSKEKRAAGPRAVTLPVALQTAGKAKGKEFKFLGFTFSKGKDGLLIRVHQKTLLKARNKLRELTKRNRGRNVRQIMAEVKRYMQRWLNYYALKQGMPKKYAFMTVYSRMGYWFAAGTTSVGRAISNERLASAVYLDRYLACESIQSDCIGRAVYRTVRTILIVQEFTKNQS